MTRTSLIVKIILLKLALSLSLTSTDKTQCFLHLRFNSTMQLINGISNDIQKLIRHFTGTVIVAFFRITLLLFGAVWVTVVTNNNLSKPR